MTKSYAAFYLPKDAPEMPTINKELTERNSLYLRSLCRKVRYVPYEEARYIDNISENMDLQGITEKVQRYVTCALSDILTNQPIKDQKMLDYLFNSYAPALNLTLVQCEFNSLQEMYNAAMAGQINVANFVQGFSDSMTAITESIYQLDVSKYGDEIPIDVVTEQKLIYEVDPAQHKTGDTPGETNNQIVHGCYICDLGNIQIDIKGTIKNESTEMWDVTNFSDKLAMIIANKTQIAYRIGKVIYEKCNVIRYIPTIRNIYAVEFEASLIYKYIKRIKKDTKRAAVNLVNPPNTPEEMFISGLTASPIYGGIQKPKNE